MTGTPPAQVAFDVTIDGVEGRSSSCAIDTGRKDFDALGIPHRHDHAGDRSRNLYACRSRFVEVFVEVVSALELLPVCERGADRKAAAGLRSQSTVRVLKGKQHGK